MDDLGVHHGLTPLTLGFRKPPNGGSMRSTMGCFLADHNTLDSLNHRLKNSSSITMEIDRIFQAEYLNFINFTS